MKLNRRERRALGDARAAVIQAELDRVADLQAKAEMYREVTDTYNAGLDAAGEALATLAKRITNVGDPALTAAGADLIARLERVHVDVMSVITTYQPAAAGALATVAEGCRHLRTGFPPAGGH